MQTFLPFRDYWESARSLDSRRLNKQAVECSQIAKILLRKLSLLPAEYTIHNGKNVERKGYWNHPAVRMWEGYESEYFKYYRAVVLVAQQRGIDVSKHMDNYLTYANLMDDVYLGSPINALILKVPRWQVPEFHLSHRCMLWKKSPSLYSNFYSDACLDFLLDYLWPLHYKETDYPIYAYFTSESPKLLFKNQTLYERYHKYVVTS